MKPRTIENMREADVTTVAQDDEEVLADEATDELSTYFSGKPPKVLITTSRKPVGVRRAHALCCGVHSAARPHVHATVAGDVQVCRGPQEHYPGGAVSRCVAGRRREAAASGAV